MYKLTCTNQYKEFFIKKNITKIRTSPETKYNKNLKLSITNIEYLS